MLPRSQGVRFATYIGLSHTKEGVRVVAVKKFGVLCYCTRHKGYDLLWALGSASCDITHETAGTICHGHWVLRDITHETRETNNFSRSLSSASCDITHEIRGTRGFRHWILRLVISHTR